jgi:hypothetical protein
MGRLEFRDGALILTRRYNPSQAAGVFASLCQPIQKGQTISIQRAWVFSSSQ